MGEGKSMPNWRLLKNVPRHRLPHPLVTVRLNLPLYLTHVVYCMLSRARSRHAPPKLHEDDGVLDRNKGDVGYRAELSSDMRKDTAPLRKL
jgi:hypothetical protein